MEKVRIGFVGCGSHSTHNLYPMLQLARAKLAAVCDVSEAAGRRVMDTYACEAWYPDVDQMLDKTALDAMIVVGPPQLHYEAAMKALKRGLPVLTEKPPAPSLRQTEEMVATAKSHGTFLMTAFMKRYALPHAKIRQYISGGRFVPHSFMMQYMHWPNQNLRDMLLFMCSHPIDLVCSFFGFPRRLQCTLGKAPNGWLTLFVNLTFPSGKVAQLALGSQLRIQEHLRISGELDGKAAFFSVDNVDHLQLHIQGGFGGPNNMTNFPEMEFPFEMSDIQLWRPDYSIPTLGHSQQFVEGYAGEIREFCNAILEKRPATPSMQESINVMRIIEAIDKNPDGTTEL